MNCYHPSNKDYLSKAMKELNKIEELQDSLSIHSGTIGPPFATS